MKALFLTIVILLLTLVGCSSKPAPLEPDVRNVRWGMTMNEVKASETAFIKSDTVTVINVLESTTNEIICGNNVVIRYYFNDVYNVYKLTELRYTLSRKFVYESDYFAIKNALSVKYGKPDSDTSDKSIYVSSKTATWKLKNNRTVIELKLWDFSDSKSIHIDYSTTDTVLTKVVDTLIL